MAPAVGDVAAGASVVVAIACNGAVELEADVVVEVCSHLRWRNANIRARARTRWASKYSVISNSV